MTTPKCQWCGTAQNVHLSVPYRVFAIQICVECFAKTQVPQLTKAEREKAIKEYQEDLLNAWWMLDGSWVKEGKEGAIYR